MHLFFDNFNSRQAGFQIGTNVGALLKTYISNARQSITIISPYISSNLIDDLRRKCSEGVHVTIVSNIHMGNNSIKNGELKQLINKVALPNYKGISEVEAIRDDINRLNMQLMCIKKLYTLLIFTLFTSLSTFVFSVMNFYNVPDTVYGYIGVFLIGLLITMAFSFLLLIFVRQRYKNKENIMRNLIWRKNDVKTEDYEYKSPFNVHVFYEFPFIHSKIYIIDNKTIFTGSFNYTNNGLFNNLETCIKSTDSGLINEITKNIYELTTNKTQYTYKEIYELKF